MPLNRHILIAGLALCVAPPASAAGAGTAAQYMLDDFEGHRHWTIDSAGNYGTSEYSSRHATQGKQALDVTVFNHGRPNTILRRETQYDFSGVGSMWLDIVNHDSRADLRCSLAFRSRKGSWFETVSRPVGPTGQRDLSFRLDDVGMGPGTDMKLWQAERDDIRRVMVLISLTARERASLTIDNLRTDSPGTGRIAPPEIVSITPLPAELRAWVAAEIEIVITRASLVANAAADDAPTYLSHVPLQARAIDPKGNLRVFRSFLKRKDDALDGNLTFALRFTPDTPGQWKFDIGLAAERRWDVLRELSFICHKASGGGFIRVDTKDPRYFSFDSGEPFFPIGQNVCWASDYEPFFKAMQTYGGTIARVWICPWNNPLADVETPGEINLKSAAAIDRMFRIARRYGIYVQLVVAYHGWLGSDWTRNPFSRANGGAAATPQDFWADAGTRHQFMGYLNYVVDRWASEPNLFAWELFNEAELTPRYRDSDIVGWHRQVSEYLKAVDPYNHLITTSVATDGNLVDLWRLPAIDFTTTHVYSPNVTKAITGAGVEQQQVHKPFFITEIGRSTTAEGDQGDPEGRHLHHALWLSWMTPAAGVALPWWWDTYIEPFELYGHFTPIAKFSGGEDRRGRALRQWTDTIDAEGRTLQVQGLVGRDAVYAFVYDLEPVERPDRKPRNPLMGPGHKLTVEGLIDGVYDAELWNTYSGAISSQSMIRCAGGTLVIPLPANKTDFAIKARLVGDASIRVSVE